MGGLPPHRNATTREAAKYKEKMAVVNEDDEKLADDKLSVSPSDPFRLANLEDGGGKEVMTEEQEDEEELLRDLVARYAKESAVLSREEDDTMYLLRVEHLKRELSMFRAAQHLHANASALETSISKMAETLLPPEQVRRIKAELEPLGHSEKTQEKKSLLRGLLRVTVVAARNLPRMDILRSTDAYCLVFLSEPYGESVTGAVTFRTETIWNSLNPVWNADIELPIMSGATALTVSIFDHDAVTSDDLVGIVHVHISEHDVWVQEDKWYPLHNYQMDENRLNKAELHLKITRLPNASDLGTRLPSVV